MKRLLALLLVLVMCLSMIGCVEREDREDAASGKHSSDVTKPKETEPEETKPKITGATPLLYKVSDEKGNVIWLFGSIHVGRQSFYPLPESVMEAFRGSDALAVEVDILALEENEEEQVTSVSQMVYTDGTTIAEHMPQDVYEQALEAMKELDIYRPELEHCMPVVWMSGLQSAVYERAGAQVSLGIDRYLLQLAKEQEKPVLEVESAQMQYNLLAGLSEETQVYLLQQVLMLYQMPRAAAISVGLLMNQWAGGDEDRLSAYFGLQSSDALTEQQSYGEYSDALTGQRNVDMTQYAIDALESGEEIFICVGAAHVVGEDAMAENLRQLGYTVEIVR